VSSEREIRIRVGLSSGAFNSGVDQMVRKSKEGARQAGQAWRDSMRAGMDAGVRASGASLRGLISNLTSGLKTAATLGGALTLGGMIKSSVELSDRLGEIAFNIEKSTGRAVEWRDLAEEIGKIAEDTGRRTGELADAFDAVFKATGNADVAKASIEPIAKISTATGKSVLQLAEAASVLHRKFGATAETMPGMLTRFIEKTDAGGLSIDDLGRKFNLMAGEAAEAGFAGGEGLSQLLGVLTMLDARIGEGATPGLKKLFQTLKSGSASLQEIEKKSGIKFTADSTAFEKLEQLMGGKGRKVIETKLSGESRAVFDELAKSFDVGGVDGFRRAMAEAGRSSLTYGKILEKAADEVKDPAEQLNIALDKLEAAFVQPKMIEAIGQIAQNAPALAEGLAKIMSFVVRHPVLAGATVLGGRVAAAGAVGMAGSMLQGLAGAGTAAAAGSAAQNLAKTGSAAAQAGTGMLGFAASASRAAGLLGVIVAAMVAVVGTIEALKEEAEHEAMEKTRARGEQIRKKLAEGTLRHEDLTRSQREALDDAAHLEDIGGSESPLAFQELEKMRKKRTNRRADAMMLGVEESFFGSDKEKPKTFPIDAGGLSLGGKPLEFPKELDVKNPDKIASATGSATAKALAGQTLNVRVTNMPAGGVGGGGSEGDPSKGPAKLDAGLVLTYGGATPRGG
jgi:hypothetical protein